jgi:amino acid adenylation domain-containing protein
MATQIDPSAGRLTSTDLEVGGVHTDWHRTHTAYPQDACIHDIFEMQALKSPDTCALIFNDRTLTYADLNYRANQLASYLVESGVGPEVTVGICAERSIEVIVGLLGILKAGGTCLPLDPEYPKDRLSFMLRDGNVQFMVVDGQFLQRLPEHQAKIIRLDSTFESVGASSKRLSPCISQENLAYVIYTSGSTGMPKGVEVTHRGIVKLLFGSNYVNLDETKTILQLSTLTFDGSIFEIWGALLNGGRCVLYPGRVPLIGELGELIRKNRITTASFTPSLFNAIVDEDPAVLASLEQLALGGEAPSVSHIRRACDYLPNLQIINCYGPTEATVDACSFLIGTRPDEGATSIPIGRPIENTRVHVLDSNLQPVPLGVAGELYLGGDRLARGYRNRPELTAERFISDPFTNDPKARLFKTGDVARFRADGNIDFLGRIDDQVKVRGYRIELGEIEASLRRHVAVRDAVVLVDENPRREKHLSAFVVRKPKIEISVHELRELLRRELPEFMVPSYLCVLDQWPLTSSGKVDRQALATLRAASSKMSSENLLPRTDLEKALIRIWEQILDCGPVGIRDNFFDLGGNSLHAVRLLAQIEEVFEKRLPIASLLGAATIEQLGGLLLQEESCDRLAYAVPIQSKGDKPIFFCVGAGPLLRPLSEHLGSEQPFFSVGLRSETIEHFKPPFQIEELAQHVVLALREKQPEGPYYLGGFCDDGLFAYEMARQLMKQGQIVGLLALFETANPRPNAKGRIATGSRRLVIRLRYRVNQLFRLKISEFPVYVLNRREELKDLLTRISWYISRNSQILKRKTGPPDMGKILFLAASSYEPTALACPTVMFRGKDFPIASAGDPYFGWRELLTGRSETYEVPGDHDGIFREPNVKTLAEQLRACLHNARETERTTHKATAKDVRTHFVINDTLI